MKGAYVDASCVVAIAFGEPSGDEVAARIDELDEVYSSNLLEAEVRSALARKSVEGGDDLLRRVRWIFPNRSLGPEIRRVIDAGYLRGSDLWHVATALYLAEHSSELPFLTLDARQREVADRLGFPS